MAADGPLVLTIDVGSSSARALLFDARANQLPGVEGRASYSMSVTPDGGVEGDPAALLSHVEETIDALLAQAGPLASRIGAVACCTFWHSLMGVDAAGATLTPVHTWADTRSTEEWRALRREFDERAFHERTGGFFHPCYHPAKLRWLSRTQPDVFRRAARWVSFGEHLFERLFGRWAATVSMASATGLLDARRAAYDPEALAMSGIREDQLSPLVDVADAFRGLREPYALRWPALREVPWTPPVGDGAASSLGSGCATPERVCVMVGTSGALRVVRPAEGMRIVPGVFAYRADRRRAVLGGALSEGGNLVEWVRSTFRIDDLAAAEREMEAMEPDGHGFTFLPFLAGERAPGYAADARAAILGLRLGTRPSEVLRAGMEAVALRFALILRLVREAAPEAREVVASGGALLKSRVWTRILADALGCPIAESAEPEASCRGAALLTLEALGVVKRLEDVPSSFGPVLEPDPAARDRYLRALDRQERVYGLLVGA